MKTTLEIRILGTDNTLTGNYYVDDEPIKKFLCFLDILTSNFISVHFNESFLDAYNKLVSGETIAIYLDLEKYYISWPTDNNDRILMY